MKSIISPSYFTFCKPRAYASIYAAEELGFDGLGEKSATFYLMQIQLAISPKTVVFVTRWQATRKQAVDKDKNPRQNLCGFGRFL